MRPVPGPGREAGGSSRLPRRQPRQHPGARWTAECYRQVQPPVPPRVRRRVQEPQNPVVSPKDMSLAGPAQVGSVPAADGSAYFRGAQPRQRPGVKCSGEAPPQGCSYRSQRRRVERSRPWQAGALKFVSPTAWTEQYERSRQGNPRQISERTLESSRLADPALPARSGCAHPARHPEGAASFGQVILPARAAQSSKSESVEDC